ncbi:amide hydrolase [Undibacterium sp. YM2]|uniref:serine hydrolase domain-containing protein n=1 Tax=Undibacterium sp. YM2 TaxID=2058625 RepID=UPI001331EB1E|nr:serine hydrolase [Undibacterium sp. YM2]BBB69821.1 amide hydrolase [Undibacterium sp. YM2]
MATYKIKLLTTMLMMVALTGNAATVFPGTEWDSVASTSAQCKQGQAELDGYVQKQATTALLAIKDGRILYNHGPVEVPGIIESQRKSILSMLYGKYVANGAINLDQTLEAAKIDDVGGLLPTEKQARLRDLLTARSGVFHVAANSGDDLANAPARGTQTPGSYFLYNNWDFNAAGTALENATHKSVYQLFDEDIAQTLQFQDFKLSAQKKWGDRSKSMHLPYHFLLSTRDMARIGLLALHEGNWNGRQLIPADWMHLTTSIYTPSSDMHPASTAARHVAYGYMWWVLEEPAGSPLQGAYMAWGLHGQYLLVIPRLDMVIAHQRRVPVDGKWDVPKVGKNAFIHMAKLLTQNCS